MYDQTYCCLADNAHEVGKVECKLLEGKSMLLVTLYKKVTKKTQEMFQKHTDPLYIGPD